MAGKEFVRHRAYEKLIGYTVGLNLPSAKPKATISGPIDRTSPQPASPSLLDIPQESVASSELPCVLHKGNMGRANTQSVSARPFDHRSIRYLSTNQYERLAPCRYNRFANPELGITESIDRSSPDKTATLLPCLRKESLRHALGKGREPCFKSFLFSKAATRLSPSAIEFFRRNDRRSTTPTAAEPAPRLILAGALRDYSQAAKAFSDERFKDRHRTPPQTWYGLCGGVARGKPTMAQSQKTIAEFLEGYKK